MWMWCFSFKKWQAWREYHVPSPSDETECNHIYLFTTWERNRSATTTNIFRSIDYEKKKVFLYLLALLLSKDKDIRIPLLLLSSIIYSGIFFFFEYGLCDLYFCIQFQKIDTWFLLKKMMIIFQLRFFLMKDHKSTSIMHSQCTLKVFFCFWKSQTK